MKPDELLSPIDPEAIARDTLEFVKVRSETGSEGAGSQFLVDLLRREGFEVQLDEVQPDRPNVYARVPGAKGDSAPALLFNGHTDTIPVGDSLPPARDGDWIVGRGTEDMKGGLVAMVHAASALRKAGVPLDGDLWLTGVVGHEAPRGKKEGPRRLIEHLRSGEIPADAIVIVEGPCAIWSASLGMAMFSVRMLERRGAIHTIKVPYADNPVCRLGRLLREFEQLEERFEDAAPHPLCGREQINVGMVKAGDYPNRLPTEVEVTGTRRWAPGKTADDVRAELQQMCERAVGDSGLQIELVLHAPREPFETPLDHPVVTALREAGKCVSGLLPDVIGMGLVGDANLYANDGGVPTVYYGPAHETAHSDHERVSISQLSHCAKVYALTALAYCGPANS
jgi:succinyl-diaminopimelate desuccinylase